MIDINEDCVTNAHIWLRKEYNIPEYEIIYDRFCEEFNCDIEWTDNSATFGMEGALTFATKLDEFNFRLRWE